MRERGVLLFCILILILISGCQRPVGEAAASLFITCEDSDQGLDYYHYGQVIYRNDIYADECLDSNTLLETYCVADRHLEAQTYTCEFTCSQGKCTTE